jgi:hypothetical protein
MSRILGIVIIAVVSPLSALAVSGSAVAVSPAKKAGVVCNFVGGTANQSTGKVAGKLSKCNDKANTNGQATFAGTFTSPTETVVWSGKGTTVIDSVQYIPVSGACTTEYQVTGTVQGGTGAAAHSIPVGWVLNSYICLTPKASGVYQLSLAPGTQWTLT